MPVLAGGVYHHTDWGKTGAAGPFYYSLTDNFVSGAGHSFQPANQPVWSYTAPADTKVTLHSLNIQGAAQGSLGSILFDPLRSNRKPLAVLTWLVDAAATYVWEGRGKADSEDINSNDQEDGSLQEVVQFGDGIQFTAGQEFTATAVPADFSLTDGLIYPQVHRLRMWGKRTDTGAFMSITAVAYPPDLTTATLTWNGTTAASYTVPAGGFTLLGLVWSTDAHPDYTLMLFGNIRLNGTPIFDIGPICSTGWQTTQPLTVPLWGVELYPGDVLELQGSCNGACNQAITVLLNGVETPYASATTYLMRAYNTNLAQHVYWHHTAIDTVGTFSGYDPGDLTDILLISIIPG